MSRSREVLCLSHLFHSRIQLLHYLVPRGKGEERRGFSVIDIQMPGHFQPIDLAMGVACHHVENPQVSDFLHPVSKTSMYLYVGKSYFIVKFVREYTYGDLSYSIWWRRTPFLPWITAIKVKQVSKLVKNDTCISFGAPEKRFNLIISIRALGGLSTL